MVIPAGDANAPSDSEPRQIAVYRAYLQLQSLAQERYSGVLGGHLLLCLGFGQREAELALATTIAGGVFLGIEPDPQRLKAAVRAAACDFMVNTLDEALRVLKNELRKRAPLSAGLLGNPAGIVPAMVERGVQPDLIAAPSEMSSTNAEAREALDRLVERGAELLTFPDSDSQENRSQTEIVWTASNRQDLDRLDKIAVENLPAGDLVRRSWLEGAATSFYRQKPLERVLDLAPQQRVDLLEAFRRENAGFPLQAPALLRWRDADGTEQTVSID